GVTFSLYEKGELDLQLNLDGWSIFPYSQFEFSEEICLTPPFPKTVAISNSRGKIRIIGTNEEAITIRLTKIIRTKTREKAELVSQKLYPIVISDDSQLLITSNRDEFPHQNIRLDFQLTLPRTLKVDIKNSYGLVRIEAVAEATVKNFHGRVEVEDISGNVKINNSYQGVTASRVGQNLTIKSRNSKVKVNQVGQAVLITHAYGAINLVGVQGPTTIEAHHSSLQAENLQALCQIETSYRPISLFQTRAALIATKNSVINIVQNRGKLEIRNSYGRLKIIDSQGDIQIRGKNLKVVIQDSGGENLDLLTSYRDVELRNITFTHSVNLDTAHNSIYLSLGKISGPLKINGKYTSIFFAWPPEMRVPLWVSNKGGKIIWKLEAKPQFFTTNGTSHLEAFGEEKTESEIKIQTSYGQVVISPKTTTQNSFYP
ncbi:hypothetical protein NLC35_01305, partial [Candidatus Aminicenantes bacterium AC-334-K16]|nr:hypothetical protein [Candidatus Aminicenantes bacterium AC-334-K16]